MSSSHTLRAVNRLNHLQRSLHTVRKQHAMTSELLKPPALAKGFPDSTARPSRVFNFSGVTPQSTEAVRKVLTENDHAYDMFEPRPRRYAHNHFPHSALSRYALGASGPLIQADWEYDRPHIAPLDPIEGGRESDIKGLDLPGKFTRDNWANPKWFMKKGAYSRYIAFFHEEVSRLGREEAVRQYVFGATGNGATGGGNPRNALLLYGGALHPMLHIGFGLEFSDDVVTAEGLALLCVTDEGALPRLFPEDWPAHPLPKPEAGYASSLLDIYFEFCRDPVISTGPYDPDVLIGERMRNALNSSEKQQHLRDLVASWDLSDLTPTRLHELQGELGFLTTLLTSGTSRPRRKPRIDFFLMHMLTSSLFVPSFAAILDEKTTRVFIQGYLLACLHLAIARGKPEIYPDVIMGYTQYPSGPAPNAADSAPGGRKLHAIGDPKDRKEANPWLEIVDNALVAHDSHVPKSIRSLVYYAQHWGHVGRGEVPGVKSPEQIKNAKNLTDEERRWWTEVGDIDGTVFVRGAGVFMDVLGWTKEGTEQGEFDRSALGWAEAWDGEPMTAEWHRKDD